ncbi:zinc ribbon domain-containing protein [Clostridium sp. 3-3]|uniref:zinc ribbon domain-containing protein n=1 Tax=Clostridium sp. 3-3 TaxID=2070757 RepID=UPI0015E1A7D4|nr:zinc ribbon domain-containing protein [Clostridium sp. 3-3]
MSLINCPECGKENVSDSAIACPSCGYSIKVHFEKIKQEELSKHLMCNKDEEKQRERLINQKREEDKIKSIPKPEKPVFNRGLIVYLIIATIIISLLFLYLPISISDSPSVGYWFFELLVFVGLPLVIYYSSFSKKIRAYNLAQQNFYEYQKQVIREQDLAVASAQVAAATRAIEEAKKPECPYCHSHNTTKITATTKVVNTAMFGIFGQKRKHQWHCNSCKSDF